MTKKKQRSGEKAVEIRDVAFTGFRMSRKEVSVNGRKLPIAIGDRIRMCEADSFGRTVMGVTVHEDGRVQYILEWHDPSTGNFGTEALTLSELKLLTMNAYVPKKDKAGFSEKEEH